MVDEQINTGDLCTLIDENRPYMQSGKMISNNRKARLGGPRPRIFADIADTMQLGVLLVAVSAGQCGRALLPRRRPQLIGAYPRRGPRILLRHAIEGHRHRPRD